MLGKGAKRHGGWLLLEELACYLEGKVLERWKVNRQLDQCLIAGKVQKE
jgi:hypothetical protein